MIAYLCLCLYTDSYMFLVVFDSKRNKKRTNLYVTHDSSPIWSLIVTGNCVSLHCSPFYAMPKGVHGRMSKSIKM